MLKAGLTWSCYHSLVSRSLLFSPSLFSFFLSLLSLPLVHTLPACHISKALLNVRFSDAQVSAFTPPAAIHCVEGSSFLSVIEVFAATTSAAWSHDLHVSKMSKGTRKRQKKKEEAGVGGEGIYIIVVEELSKELAIARTEQRWRWVDRKGKESRVRYTMMKDILMIHIFNNQNYEGGVRMGEYDVKHGGCDVIVQVMTALQMRWRWKRGTYFLANVRWRWFENRPFNLPDMRRRMGLMLVVSWCCLQHHAQPCDGPRPGPYITFSTVLKAKLWPAFF